MKKHILYIVLFTFFGLIGCNTQPSPLEVAKTYYSALDQSDFETLTPLLGDSIISKELEYEAVLSRKGYLELQRWDSVFSPTYKILEINEVEGAVKAKISKACSRTLFLNGEPIITEETIKFRNGKVQTVSIDKYVVFNFQRWDSVRSRLVSFVDENHKELDGFLYDQTVKGALDYTEALTFYKEYDKTNP